MTTGLKALVLAVVSAASIAFVLALLLFPLDAELGGLAGLGLWIGLTLVASALPVQLPRGSSVSVSISPILAAGAIGGPSAAAIVAAFGTTEWREIRGDVPWYGTLSNHATLVLPAIAGALVWQALGPSASSPSALSFVALALAGIVYFVVDAALTTAFVALRMGRSARTVLMSDVRMVGGNLLALAPLAWLMAISWNVAWWSTLVFALPLFSTRNAYKQIVEIRHMFTQTVQALSSAVDKRDPFTKDHSARVQQIAVSIGQVMRCSEAELEALEWGGLLHDIGKIGVHDSVLLKPGKLTREERIEMNRHPVMGAEIILPVTRLAPEVPIIRHHHEWFNGSGYPDHLAGDQIPKLARIVHVADAFEAMTAKRPYRMTPLTPEQALAELRKFAGIQFDPEVLDAFTRTDWVANVPDPAAALPQAAPLPLLSQVASLRARPATTSVMPGREAD